MPSREQVLRYKKEGRCQICSCHLPPSRVGMVRCVYCQRKNDKTPSKRRYDARRREQRKKEGRCVTCGRPLMEEEAGRVICFECHNKNLLRRDINGR